MKERYIALCSLMLLSQKAISLKVLSAHNCQSSTESWVDSDYYCCMQGQLCDLCPWFWPSGKMIGKYHLRMILGYSWVIVEWFSVITEQFLVILELFSEILNWFWIVSCWSSMISVILEQFSVILTIIEQFCSWPCYSSKSSRILTNHV